MSAPLMIMRLLSDAEQDMSMQPRNLLLIMSDEHSKRVLGCYGHPMIRTPNLDRLAASGVRFTDAYCNSPICVPSRASFRPAATCTTSASGTTPSPMTAACRPGRTGSRRPGHRVDSIGKLHFRSPDEDHGFTQEHMPLHVVEGIGDPIGMLRDPLPQRKAALRLAAEAGCGDSNYQGYDDRITEAAEGWLRERAGRKDAKPWVLFVSLVCPHFPLIARPEWYNLYPEDKVPWPRLYAEAERPTHPYVQAMRAVPDLRPGLRRPGRCARRSPPISAWSASSTTMSGG